MNFHLIWVSSDYEIHHKYFTEELDAQLTLLAVQGVLLNSPCILGICDDKDTYTYFIKNYYTAKLDFIKLLYSSELGEIIPKCCIEQWCQNQITLMQLNHLR